MNSESESVQLNCVIVHTNSCYVAMNTWASNQYSWFCLNRTRSHVNLDFILNIVVGKFTVLRANVHITHSSPALSLRRSFSYRCSYTRILSILCWIRFSAERVSFGMGLGVVFHRFVLFIYLLWFFRTKTFKSVHEYFLEENPKATNISRKFTCIIIGWKCSAFLSTKCDKYFHIKLLTTTAGCHCKKKANRPYDTRSWRNKNKWNVTIHTINIEFRNRI